MTIDGIDGASAQGDQRRIYTCQVEGAARTVPIRDIFPTSFHSRTSSRHIQLTHLVIHKSISQDASSNLNRRKWKGRSTCHPLPHLQGLRRPQPRPHRLSRPKSTRLHPQSRPDRPRPGLQRVHLVVQHGRVWDRTTRTSPDPGCRHSPRRLCA